MMGMYYGRKIQAGLMTLADGPVLWRKMTKSWLDGQEG